MNQKILSELTDEELIAEAKKIKSTTITHAVLIGVIIGIAVYSTVKNGLGFFTFFPILFLSIGFNSAASKKAVDNEVKQRKLIQ